MNRIIVSLLLFLFCNGLKAQSPQYIVLQVYHSNSAAQVQQQAEYLKDALLPALHAQGVRNVGAFEALANDTAALKQVYVLYAVNSLKDWENIKTRINANVAYKTKAASFLNASVSQAPFTRMEQILLRSFEKMPRLAPPKLTTAKDAHVYELRSYESATEASYRNKVEMFNAGGETVIFDRLGFNAVFYGDVLMGSRMPNLMYMTAFENKAERDAHWKRFGEDAAWKTLSAMPKYQKNVSKIDITFLRAFSFSDF